MARTRPRTHKLANGTTVTRLVSAPPLEWQLQAAGVRALRALPQYGTQFTIAADFNAARRSPQEAVKAKATGIAAGEHDLRVYLAGGRLGLIEQKTATGRLSPEQRDRHALLHQLGFTRQEIVKTATEDETAARYVAIVLGWLAANDDKATAEAVQAA